MPPPAVPPREPGGTALRGLFVLALLAFVKLAQPLLAPIVFALVLTVVLAPAVRALRRRGVPEFIGAGVVVTAGLASVVPLAAALAEPAAAWWARAPEVLAGLLQRLERLRAAVPGLDSGGPGAGPGALGERLASEGVALTGLVLGHGLAFALSASATVILLYFLLASEHWLLARAVRTLRRPRQRALVLAGLLAAQRDIGRFLWSLTLINIGVALVVALGLQAIGMPDPLLWGVVCGVLNFIPYLGPVIIVVLLGLAGLLAFGHLGAALAPPALFLAVHAIEANLIAPWFVGRRLVLSPISVFLAVMVWGWLWGMAGALIAVPLLIGLRALCRRWPPLRWLAAYLDGRQARPPPLRSLLAPQRPAAPRRGDGSGP
ncbi:hypothetical protein CKO43_00900 [Rubrivivax gelatinosus]|uniref:PurR-regulated permease PerM n=1 Tax=Rubrivivax gelatinosus TaxID=28068 RepID=A0ABS1DQ62_RUBGE|nr:hypothetical protein [Rubrivivax gelatinosus]